MRARIEFGQLPIERAMGSGQLPMRGRRVRLEAADSEAWVDMTFSPD
jgi:hypothetical protein